MADQDRSETIADCEWRQGAWCSRLWNEGRQGAAGSAEPPATQDILDHIWKSGPGLQAFRCHAAEGRPCPHAPVYDRKTRRLYVHGREVRCFAPQAKNLLAVVSAFQEQGWIHEIADPLFHGPEGDYEKHPDDYERHLAETAAALNKVQKKPQLVDFASTDAKQKIRWDFLDQE